MRIGYAPAALQNPTLEQGSAAEGLLPNCHPIATSLYFVNQTKEIIVMVWGQA